MITQMFIAKSGNAMGKPEGAFMMWVRSIPTITGKIIIAPSARYLLVMKRIPPTISAVATRGINQVIVIKAPINFNRPAGMSLGIGM